MFNLDIPYMHTSAHTWRAQDVWFIARLNKLKLVKKKFLPALGLKQYYAHDKIPIMLELCLKKFNSNTYIPG